MRDEGARMRRRTAVVWCVLRCAREHPEQEHENIVALDRAVLLIELTFLFAYFLCPSTLHAVTR